MANQFKTGMLLIIMTGLFLVLGYLLGGQAGMFIALVFAGVMNISSYWYSDKIVLKMYQAQPLERSQAPGLFDIVARLASRGTQSGTCGCRGHPGADEYDEPGGT